VAALDVVELQGASQGVQDAFGRTAQVSPLEPS
jgi:hypothetical protein